MAARSNRALFVMDLGVPRNVDPTATDLYNLYVYNIRTSPKSSSKIAPPAKVKFPAPKPS